MKYKLWNNLIGWVAFLISAIVYLMTIEPTASFWDCGEFIATAFKLEVGHPPGAPLFMIMGRIFTLFAGSDTELVPIMMNSMSALASAFTILFLFWTITHFAKKMVAPDGVINLPRLIAIMGSGFVGALAYTFSDTFWFSAVEAEVYASSSFFTAIVFWAICKWENVADEPHSNRWLIFIAYILGLSIGVHLLNLLAIPAIVFVYYFRKYKPSRKGVIWSTIISLTILGTIMYIIIPGLIKVASKFELAFVNGMGLPFKTGVFVYGTLLLALIFFGIWYTHKKGKVLLNTVILVITVIIIGYSSFAMIVIRSLANPPMDENNPENVFSLLSYLNREQYGDRPLVYGQYYNAPLDPKDPVKKGGEIYIQGKVTEKKNGKEVEKDKYIMVDQKEDYNYDSRFCSVFPRMWSPEGSHIRAYKEWGKIKGTPINAMNNNGEVEKIYKPTFVENLRFFFTYQVGHMYFRYFMWNFAGRQNDIQGHGNILHGNWISGVSFIDEMRLGPQDSLPYDLQKNKARNTYFFLPMILGLLGMFFQLNREKNGFWTIMLLFVLTGIAIVVYLNQYPYQPRERDYAYAGSFYAFAIWIGFGVAAIYSWFSTLKVNKTLLASLVTAVTFIAVPYLMASENWDDHDRSHRYTARDFAKNYLNSCDENAIIFTNGDNDTFPLWYAQEVEGIRTDIRVVNLSLFNTDWYVDQMKRKAYDSDPIPNSFSPDQYVQGTRDYLPVVEKIKTGVELKKLMEFIRSDHPDSKIDRPGSKTLYIMPTRNFILPVNRETVLATNTITQKDTSRLLDKIEWKITKNYVLKSELMVLDILAQNEWKRPVYFAITVGSDSYLNLENFFRLDGLAYRLVPYSTTSKDGQIGDINSDILYDRLMNRFVWGNLNSEKVYLDENNLRMAMNFRNNFARLANKLLDEGKRDSAVQVLDRCMEQLPNKTVPFNYFVLGIAEAYYRAGESAKADEIMNSMYDITKRELDYYFSLKPSLAKYVENESRRAMAVFQEMLRISRQFRKEGNLLLPDGQSDDASTPADTGLYKKMEEEFKIYFEKYGTMFEI
jgi:hypothetical protein